MVKKWIQKVHLKSGALSKQLGIPVKDNIPTEILEWIVNAKIGTKILNTNSKGKAGFTVTKLLKRRAQFALNVRK